MPKKVKAILGYIGTDEDETIVGVAWWPNARDGLQFFGNGGNDTVIGSNGDDLVVGGLGDDTVDGRAGDDELWGDEIGGDGTAGADTFVFRWNGEGTDTVMDFSARDKLDLHFLFNAVTQDENGFWILAPLTMDDLTITSSDATHHRIETALHFGGPVYPMAIDVVGVAPTEENIIF